MYSVHGTRTSLARTLIPALLTATFSAPLAAQQSESSNSQRIDTLEQRLESLQQQVTESSLERVHLNGFVSTGFTRATNDAGYGDATEKSDLTTLSLFGLQSTFVLARNTEAVIQLVSRGSEDWDTEAEWGFLKHGFGNGLEVRAGKMRLPLFMESETLEIGYGQPWVRPPESVYDPVPLRSYVGGDLSYTLPLPGSILETRIFSGHAEDQARSVIQTEDVTVELRNLNGLSLLWTDYVWTLRGVYAHTRADIDAESATPLADDDKTEFMGLGFSYDDGAWILLSEVTRIEMEDEYQNTDSAYLTFGRRIFDVTPYITASWIESKDNHKRHGTPLAVLDVRRQAYSLGFRWDIVPGLAAKVDWTHSRGFGKTTGGLIGNQSAVSELGLDVENRPYNSTDVYTFKLDAAF